MLIVMWGFIFLLAAAVIFLIWLQFKGEGEQFDTIKIQQLEKNVLNLEENLKKTLEIMQDLAKKMHVQQEVLDQTTQKLQQVELQNAELVALIAQAVDGKK
ncbi:hypothetical protein GFH30_08240 [Acinetobacter wanghuae]|uniref:DUF2730 family protein n=1 Tax=Acinetobacter wanghuae TaxID=2662362 RepID=A0A5Q0P456_9GAMM|nr:hypothetical protein [Acinetobacter wanghuae]MQW91068.1 hypothetical protein [Acinetobacter wanghuae]QGA11383.1 hypothetical protein GFH30_08240 [Acinetobacter wanghuae]